MKFLIFLLAILFSQLVHASFTKGNGGNILVCSDGFNRVLDYYELTEIHHLQYDQTLSPFQENIHGRLMRISPVWAKSYTEIMSDLNNRIRFVTDDLGKVDDAEVIMYPSICELKQTAIQINGRILINKSLYNSLNSDQQNILILHEVLFTIILNDHELENSRPVRALAALLLSEEFKTMNKDELNLHLKINSISVRP
jgi:hypothetical protein